MDADVVKDTLKQLAGCAILFLALALAGAYFTGYFIGRHP